MSVFVRDSLSGGMVEVGRDGRIGLYVCGPTVYDHVHVGNARAPLFWDVVVRYLRSRGYDVTFVQNITDIEDKIINKANAEGVSWQEIVDRYTDSFHERLASLGIGLPDVEPRATEHIPEMISLIEELIERGHAYAPGNGDVYFSVESFPEYGSLSHQNPKEMRETEKGQTEDKRSPLDFALWKASKPGEPSWDGPWGPGRPGWHIECSALALRELGTTVDLHGGGADLIFPHHECEAAQSEAATGRTFVRRWMHVGMVRLGGEKMSKSLGNLVFVSDLLKDWEPAAVRLALLAHHYRESWEWEPSQMSVAAERLERWRAAGPGEAALDAVRAALDEDLDTPAALAAVDEAVAAGGGASMAARLLGVA